MPRNARPTTHPTKAEFFGHDLRMLRTQKLPEVATNHSRFIALRSRPDVRVSLCVTALVRELHPRWTIPIVPTIGHGDETSRPGTNRPIDTGFACNKRRTSATDYLDYSQLLSEVWFVYDHPSE